MDLRDQSVEVIRDEVTSADASSVRGSYRKFQLCAMGIVAILIAPFALVDATLVHGLPFPASISETGTMSNTVSPILPLCLGALALFSLTYAVKHKYSRLDSIFTTGVFVGFVLVAVQMCRSPYVDGDCVGVFGLSPAGSNLVHLTGAFLGFASLIGWVVVCFPKSDMPPENQTHEKRVRNKWYFALGFLMSLSLAVYVLDLLGVFGENFPVVFVIEWTLLTLMGVACCIKGGFLGIMTDKCEKPGAPHTTDVDLS